MKTSSPFDICCIALATSPSCILRIRTIIISVHTNIFFSHIIHVYVQTLLQLTNFYQQSYYAIKTYFYWITKLNESQISTKMIERGWTWTIYPTWLWGQIKIKSLTDECVNLRTRKNQLDCVHATKTTIQFFSHGKLFFYVSKLRVANLSFLNKISLKQIYAENWC
jgi:hypothetical protein